MRFLLFLFLVKCASSLECFTCNDGPGDDDTQQCLDRKTICLPGVDSCSMAVYMREDRTHVRKFCTPSNTPLLQYLKTFPGSSTCQNVDMARMTSRRSKRGGGPPASPSTKGSSLLCVCSTPLCNRGKYEEVVENTMFNNLPRRLIPAYQGEKKDRTIPVRDHPDMGLMEQMANAGF